MKKTLLICLAATSFMHLKSWAKDPYVDVNTTMCMEGEDIYISCAFNSGEDEYDYTGKVASICAKSNTSPGSGYVQYRYGKPSYGAGQAKIEMQFPEKKSHQQEYSQFTTRLILKVEVRLFALLRDDTFTHSKA